MKGFSFDSFVVHETNQAAFDMCSKMAALETDVPKPIVLLGESGSGKSHLLWAIVNQFREKNAKVGVALISSKDFPNKVRNLPDNPEKLQKKYPVILIVDELHLFEKEAAALERVILAFQEYNQYVVVATNIHPSILPSISGKLKAYLNNGAIIGIKPLPKTDGAPIPEAAVKQIAELRARIAELEAAKSSAPAAPSQDAQNEIKALRQQVEELTHERDAARAALDKSEGELIDLKEELARLKDAAPAKTPDVDEIVDRLEKQKAALLERINALEKQLEELIAFTETIAAEGEKVVVPDLNAIMDQEESDLLRVIDGIRDTLKNFEEEGGAEVEDAAASVNAQKTLATIFEQLKTLDMLPKEKKSDQSVEESAESAEVESGEEADSKEPAEDEASS
jgi:ABC-type dipeptide/oligopeptide/nickel transport system ATPase component